MQVSENSNPPMNYSKLYFPPDENSGDDPRVRLRIISAYLRCVQEDGYIIATLIESQLGIECRHYEGMYFNWKTYLMNLEYNDFLSVFSVLTLGVLAIHHSTPHIGEPRVHDFRKALNSIFAEENVLLTFGEDLIVHPKIDGAFEYQRISLIKGIQGDEYKAAREHLTATEDALVAMPPDGAAAIRSIFLLAENIFKQMFDQQSLNSKAASLEISKLVALLYQSGSNELRVAEKQIQGFQRWIDGAHFYRHEEGLTEISQPADEMFTLTVSEGFAYCRWLAALRSRAAAKS